MAGTKRKACRSGSPRKHLTKDALLPMTAANARKLSLTHHLALAACRSDRGDSRLINELARAVYTTYFLQRAGFGDAPFELYEHAEAAIEHALSVAAKTGAWRIDEADAPSIERLLALHDEQLLSVPLHRVNAAEAELRRFVAGKAPSPLVRPSQS